MIHVTLKGTCSFDKFGSWPLYRVHNDIHHHRECWNEVEGVWSGWLLSQRWDRSCRSSGPGPVSCQYWDIGTRSTALGVWSCSYGPMKSISQYLYIEKKTSVHWKCTWFFYILSSRVLICANLQLWRSAQSRSCTEYCGFHEENYLLLISDDCAVGSSIIKQRIPDVKWALAWH